MTKVECVWPIGALLGEGPFWSAPEQAVWFVDIKGRAIHRYHEPTGETRTWAAPADPGFILPAHDGTLIAGLQTGLHRFDAHTGRFTLLYAVEPHEAHNRLNDGYVDDEGYLWFGSMDDHEKDPSGALYQLTDDGLKRRDADYCITNGPACSPDGRTLYHTDTLKRVIYAFDRTREGELSNRRVFTRMGADDGYPDGPIADSTGVVWSGLYGGWGVNQYTPAGMLLGKLPLPCSNVTKQAFGGADLRTLYITTAWKGLSEEDHAKQPLAGGLFRVRVDTPGLPQSTIRHGL